MANRYFVPELVAGTEITADDDLAHHLVRVLRLGPGDEVELGDGRGTTANAVLVRADRRAAVLAVGPTSRAAPVRPAVTVAFAAARLPRTEWLLEHGCEVGIHAFQPLWCERSRPQGLRHDRFERIVRAAAGQCNRAWLPVVHEARDLAAWLGSPDLPAMRLLGAAGAPPLAPANCAEVVLLVGPEGGLTAGERALALAAGFVERSYGPHVLRTETAALVGAAVLLQAAT